MTQRKEEFEGRNGKLDARIYEGGVNRRAESKIGETSRAFGWVAGDGVRRGGFVAGGITKTKSNEVVNSKEGNGDAATDCCRLYPGIVGIARDVVKGGNEFVRRVGADVAQKEIISIIEG